MCYSFVLLLLNLCLIALFRNISSQTFGREIALIFLVMINFSFYLQISNSPINYFLVYSIWTRSNFNFFYTLSNYPIPFLKTTFISHYLFATFSYTKCIMYFNVSYFFICSHLICLLMKQCIQFWLKGL